MNYKNLVKQTIEAINESNDCIWNLSTKVFLGEKRLYFTDNSHKFDHWLAFGSHSEMYIFLIGMQKGANSIKQF